MKDELAPTANLLIDMSGWYMETALLEWALDVRLPQLLASGPLEAEGLSGAIGIDRHRLAAVLDGLVGMGVLNVAGAVYVMPDDIRNTLTEGEDAYVGDHVRHHARYWRLWAQLREMLRPVDTPQPWMQDLSVHEDRDAHELLLRSSAVESTSEERLRLLRHFALEAEDVLVDVGGGHGRLGMLASERWGCRAETWDVPNSESVWSNFAVQLPSDLQARVSFRACDLLASDTWVVERRDVTHCVISHVLANFGDAQVSELLVNVRAAFPLATLLVITPWRPHGDGRDPLRSLTFDVLIQSASKSGRAQPNDEMATLIHKAGWRVDDLAEIHGSAVWTCRIP